jgi:hypothetical protein
VGEVAEVSAARAGRERWFQQEVEDKPNRLAPPVGGGGKK